jgi:hypothetical protein
MASQKFDGVIEAVRYGRGGTIDFVRAYRRVGYAFSDRILLDRESLIEQLKSKKRFVTGQRKEYWAGTFEVGKPVKLLGQNGSEVVTTRAAAPEHDELEGVPVI